MQSVFNARFPHLAQAVDNPEAAQLAQNFFQAAKQMEAAEIQLRTARLKQMGQHAVDVAKDAADAAAVRAKEADTKNMQTAPPM